MKKQKYRIILASASTDLRNRCEKAATELYGDPVPTPVADRMNTELTAIIENGYSSHYLIAADLVNYSKDQGYPVTNRGMLASSFVAFLCGITEVNALPGHYRCSHCHHLEFINQKNGSYRRFGYDFPDKICPKCGAVMKADGADILPEVNMGLQMDREPDIILNFAPAVHQEIIDYIKTRFKKEQLFRAGVSVERTDGSTLKGVHPGGIFIVPGEVDISGITSLRSPEADENDEFNLPISEKSYHEIDDVFKKYDILKQPQMELLYKLEQATGFRYSDIRMNDKTILQAFEDKDSCFMKQIASRLERNVIQMVRPKGLADLARIKGLVNGSGTWYGNAEKLLYEDNVSLNNIVASRDDIFQYLMFKGLSKELSYNAMQWVRKGKELPLDLVIPIIEAGIPAWFIDSCDKIQYLYPWSQCVEYAMVTWKLGFYWVHYRDIYKGVV